MGGRVVTTDRVSALEESLGQSRAETRASFINRALLYAHLFDEIEAVLGPEQAAALMKRAIYRRGVEISQRYRTAAQEGDLDELARLFVGSSAAAGTLFEPSVDAVPEAGRVVLRMDACPLVQAWRDAGYPPERVDLLCEIASAVDHGTFEGVGLETRFLDRQACPGSEACLLEVRLPR